MTLFDFILSLLLVFNPTMPESAFDQVYTVLDDTQLRTVLVDDSAVEALSQLAGNAGIMPLEFTDRDSVILNNIYKQLYTGTSDSVAYWARSINQHIFDIKNTFSSFPGDFNKHALKTSQIYDFLTSYNKQSGLVGLLRVSNDNTQASWEYLSQISSQFSDFSSSNAGGWDISYPLSVYHPNGLVNVNWSPLRLLLNINDNLVVTSYSAKGWTGLLFDGSIGSIPVMKPLSALVSDGFTGLARRISDSDSMTTFSFLKDDLSGSDEVTANNLLDALGLVGTQLQNPLQRLAYVLANPQDIQIRDDVSGNVDQAQQDFFKPEGGGSVKPTDIKDAAGISGGAAGALESPGSVGDLTAQINNQDNFSFFSDVTLGNLDSVPASFSEEDDDFIDFYDPSNPALWEALSNEPVS